jgi:hypothetical protein
LVRLVRNPQRWGPAHMKYADWHWRGRACRMLQEAKASRSGSSSSIDSMPCRSERQPRPFWETRTRPACMAKRFCYPVPRLFLELGPRQGTGAPLLGVFRCFPVCETAWIGGTCLRACGLLASLGHANWHWTIECTMVSEDQYLGVANHL